MNPCWLINLSMAFDGSRYLNGASTTPAIRDDDRFVIDATPLGGDVDTTAPEFLDLARSRGLARLVLMTAGAAAPMRPDRAQALLGEFVLVAPEPQLAWHLGPTRMRDQPGERDLVRGCLATLDGADVDDDPFGIRPWGVDDTRQRLYWAAMFLSAGKLSGMGGFDDRVPVDRTELVDTVVQALAASTRTS